MTLLDRLESADPYCWVHNPSWAQEGGENFDGNWTPDCQGKIDYDPVSLHFSCRVWPNGYWCAALIFGDDCEVADTGIREAGSVEAARKAVEQWCEAQSMLVKNALIAALRAKEASSDD